MQGKERNQLDVDEQFVSDAWLAMKEMLDREMPVQAVEKTNGRKQYLLSLLLLLIVLGMGAAVWFYSSDSTVDNNNSSPTPVTTSEHPQANLEPVINTTNTTGLDLDINASITPAPASQANSLSNSMPSNSSTNATTSTNSEPPSSNNTPEHQALSSLTTNTSTLPTIKKSTSQPTDEVTFRWTTVLPENGMAPSNNTTTSQSANILAVPSTPSAEASTTESANKESRLLASRQTESLEPIFTDAPTRMIPLPTTKRWSMGIQTGKIRDNSSKQFNGWYAGLAVNYQLDRRFALQSGLEIHHLAKNSTKNDNTLSATDFDLADFEIFNTPGLRDGKDLSNLAAEKLNDYFYEQATLRNLNYLKLPLQLSYTLHPTIRINTGMNVGYLLSKVNASSTTIDGLPTLEAINKDALIQDGEVAKNVILQGLKTWDYGLEFGITLHPAKRWGIELSYNHGLQDFTDNRFFGFKESHVNQYFAVGVTYYWLNQKGS